MGLYIVQDARRDSECDDIFIGDYKQVVKHIKGMLKNFKYEEDSDSDEVDDGCNGFIEHNYITPLDDKNVGHSLRNMRGNIHSAEQLRQFLKSEASVKSSKGPKKMVAKRMVAKRVSKTKRSAKKSAKRVTKRSAKKRVSSKKKAKIVEEGCVESFQAKYQNRPGPPFPAQNCRGMNKIGNDGLMYKSEAAVNGVYRWKKVK